MGLQTKFARSRPGIQSFNQYLSTVVLVQASFSAQSELLKFELNSNDFLSGVRRWLP